LAGFQVIIDGRFWVITKGIRHRPKKAHLVVIRPTLQAIKTDL
jgi:hypothetical protein